MADVTSFDETIAFFADELDSEPSSVAGGKYVAFRLPADVEPDDVLGLMEEAQKRGATLFIVEPPMEDEEWAVGLAPVADGFAAVEAVGTAGRGGKPSTAEIVEWLRTTHATDPLIIDTITENAVGGSFVGPVRNPRALATRLYAFCPEIYDIVVQELDGDPEVAEELGFPDGVPWHEPIEVLAASLRVDGALFLFWE